MIVINYKTIVVHPGDSNFHRLWNLWDRIKERPSIRSLAMRRTVIIDPPYMTFSAPVDGYRSKAALIEAVESDREEFGLSGDNHVCSLLCRCPRESALRSCRLSPDIP